jgi:polyisoprenoid-binding protein YceI
MKNGSAAFAVVKSRCQTASSNDSETLRELTMNTELRRSGSTDFLLLLALIALVLSVTGLAKSRAVAPNTFAETRYRLDSSRSSFMVRAFAGGLLWFKGHDHFIKVREFTGEVRLTPQSVAPASLQMTIKSDSLVETRDVFTEQQKQIINKELREIVLETAKYPEITFKSTNVSGSLSGGGYFDARIEGDLTMHGVTRRVIIPAQITLGANELRAKGEFTVDRHDFNVNATSAFHGLVRIRDKLRFTFDIVANSF